MDTSGGIGRTLYLILPYCQTVSNLAFIEMKRQETSGSNDDKRDDAQNSSSSVLFSPLTRQNSIKRCYGSPSIRQAKLQLHASNQQKHDAVGRSITPALRWTTNASALLSAFLFSGIVFGWSPLKLVLIREGQYAELCRNDSSSSLPLPPQTQQQAATPCVAQMDQFNVIFTLAQFFLSFASLPVGFFLDYAPKAFHYGVATVFQVGGLLLFGMSSSSSGDYFVLAYSCLALGGCMTILGAFPASFLLPKHQAGILAGISCLFDASSVIFAIFYRLYLINDDLFSRKRLFVFYAMLGLLVYGLLSYCWGALERLDWKNIIEEEGQHEIHSNNNDDDDDKGNKSQVETDPHLARIRQIGMHERSLLQQLGTFDFLLVLCFASVHMLRCNFYIETVNEILASMGDDEATYANIFSFVLPAGVVFVPLIEMTVRQLGVIRTLHVTNALGVLFGALLLIPSLYLQVINFAIFACFRAYLYATLSTFIAVTFGVSTMGRVIGFTFTSAAIFTLLQYPAAAMAEGRHNSDFTIVNLVMLLASIVPIGLTWVYLSSTQHQSSKGLKGEGQPLLIDSNTV